MHLGVQLPHHGHGLDRLRLDRSLRAAEASGFDSAWVTDHVAVPSRLATDYGHITEALVTIAYLAGQTSRIKLGVSALVIPQRQPLLTWKQITSLDFLAGGRFILCVAAGWVEEEFRNLGHEFRGRGGRLDAWLKLIESCVRQMPGAISHDGLVKLHDAWLAPALTNPSGLSIWVAGHSEAAIARAVRFGTWHPRAMPLEEFRSLAAEFKARRPNGSIISRMNVRFSPQLVAESQDTRGSPAVVGPPEHIAERLRERVNAGSDGFLVSFVTDGAGLEDSIARFAEDVRPILEG